MFCTFQCITIYIPSKGLHPSYPLVLLWLAPSQTYHIKYSKSGISVLHKTKFLGDADPLLQRSTTVLLSENPRSAPANNIHIERLLSRTKAISPETGSS